MDVQDRIIQENAAARVALVYFVDYARASTGRFESTVDSPDPSMHVFRVTYQTAKMLLEGLQSYLDVVEMLTSSNYHADYVALKTRYEALVAKFDNNGCERWGNAWA